MKQILENKDLVIGKTYVYIDNSIKQPIVVKHEKGKFQNEQHEKDYLESQGAIYILKDLETDNNFDLHQVDYLDKRYKVYPLTVDNIGNILLLFEVKNSKVTQKIILKHFYSNN